MKISCMEWNINGRGGAEGVEKFPSFIAEKIWSKNPDIVVLVEFFKRDGWEENFCNKLSRNYVLCLSEDYGRGKNQVLIAIEKRLNPVIVGMRSYIPQGQALLDEEAHLHPEFLQVDATIEKEGERTPLSIIGTRIKTEGANKNYINRTKQYKLLISHLEGLTSNVIVMGDFNNGILRAELNEPLEKALPQYTAPEAKEYNYHIMKNEIRGNYRLLPPSKENSFSWPITLKENKIQCGPYLQDHCIVSGGIVQKDLLYSFSDFATKSNGYTVDNYPKDKWGKRSFKAGLPDHAYLYGEFSLNDKI